MAISNELFKAVQEHIDKNYHPNSDGSGIDWTKARADAHQALDSQFGSDAVNEAVDAYLF